VKNPGQGRADVKQKRGYTLHQESAQNAAILQIIEEGEGPEKRNESAVYRKRRQVRLNSLNSKSSENAVRGRFGGREEKTSAQSLTIKSHAQQRIRQNQKPRPTTKNKKARIKVGEIGFKKKWQRRRLGQKAADFHPRDKSTATETWWSLDLKGETGDNLHRGGKGGGAKALWVHNWGCKGGKGEYPKRYVRWRGSPSRVSSNDSRCANNPQLMSLSLDQIQVF